MNLHLALYLLAAFLTAVAIACFAYWGMQRHHKPSILMWTGIISAVAVAAFWARAEGWI